MESVEHELLQYVKTDFLVSSLSAMKTLFTHCKHNLLHHLAKCFKGDIPWISLNQMPFALLDQSICFFVKGKTQMHCTEKHYVSWLETMFSHFGHKWLCLHREAPQQYKNGPEVSFEEESVEEESVKEESLETESVEEIDIIQSVLQICLVYLTDWVSETLDDVNPPTVINTEIAHASQLRIYASTTQKMDIEVGLLSFQHMERIYGVKLTKNCATRNLGM